MLCSFKIPGILSEVSDDYGKTGDSPHVPYFNKRLSTNIETY